MDRHDITGRRVLFVDCAPFTGGAQNSLITLVEGLAARGWQNAVLTADRSPGGVCVRCREMGCAVHELDTRHWRLSPAGVLRFAYDRLTAGRAIAAAARLHAPCLVHANTVRAALLVPGALAREIPLVVHDRDLRLPRGALRPIRRGGRRVIAISRCVAHKWQAEAPGIPVDIVGNGFDLVAIRASAPHPEGRRGVDGPLLALVADLVPWKNHALFLEALAQLRRNGAPFGAVIVGRKRSREAHSYLADLRQQAADLGLDDRVRFVTDAGTALPWLAASDVVVSAAVDEPFGRTVVEALALGKPVVAIHGGGPEEILENCAAGTLVGDSAAHLADSIARWLDPETRLAAMAAARERSDQYAAARMVDQVCESYRKTLEAAGSVL
ncbi:MAG: glycosyltransferase [Lentisphaeria bacterium]|nr:glycosyltransferase [Lentisphaeria bacterium]